MAKLQHNLRIRTIVQIEPDDPEESTSGEEPVRFGGEIFIPAGTGSIGMGQELLHLEQHIIAMMEARGCFGVIEEPSSQVELFDG